MAIVYKVEVQPAALRDMTEIVTYITRELENPTAADNLAQRLVAAIDSLSHLPTRCPLYRPLKPLKREYRTLRVGNYLVFFCVSEELETVTVARVIYGRRDTEKVLGD